MPIFIYTVIFQSRLYFFILPLLPPLLRLRFFSVHNTSNSSASEAKFTGTSGVVIIAATIGGVMLVSTVLLAIGIWCKRYDITKGSAETRRHCLQDNTTMERRVPCCSYKRLENEEG